MRPVAPAYSASMLIFRASEKANSVLGGKSLVQSESPFAVNGHDPNSSDKVTLKSRVTPGETKQ